MGEVHRVYVSLFTLLGTLVIVASGALLNNSRLSDLRTLIEGNHANIRSSLKDLRDTLDARFNAMQLTIDALFAGQKAELLRVEQVMDARLRHLEANR